MSPAQLGSMCVFADHVVPLNLVAIPVASTATQAFLAGHDTASDPARSLRSNLWGSDQPLPVHVNASSEVVEGGAEVGTRSLERFVAAETS